MTRTKPRNPIALNPILRKGGVHRKSRKAERRALKLATRRLVADAVQRLE